MQWSHRLIKFRKTRRYSHAIGRSKILPSRDLGNLHEERLVKIVDDLFAIFIIKKYFLFLAIGIKKWLSALGPDTDRIYFYPEFGTLSSSLERINSEIGGAIGEEDDAFFSLAST